MPLNLDRTDPNVWRIELCGRQPHGKCLLDPDTVEDLSAALEEASRERCRVLVLGGEPGRFCEGLDLSAVINADESVVRRAVLSFADTLTRLRCMETLVLCLVDGPAVGGGVGLACAADMVLATDRASFSLPELPLGLLPATIFPILTHRILPQKVMRLALSGSPIDASAALALGLVDERVRDRAAGERALKRHIRHCLRCEPSSVSALKQLTTAVSEKSLRKTVRAGAERTLADLLEPERAQARLALAEGTPPPWFEKAIGGGRE